MTPLAFLRLLFILALAPFVFCAIVLAGVLAGVYEYFIDKSDKTE